MKGKDATETTFCERGPFKRMRSDNEAALIGEIMAKFKAAIGLEWHKTVAARPTTE